MAEVDAEQRRRMPSRTSSAARRIVPSPPSTMTSSMSSTGRSRRAVDDAVELGPTRARARRGRSAASTGRAPAASSCAQTSLGGSSDGLAGRCADDDEDAARCVGHACRAPASRFTVLIHSVGLLAARRRADATTILVVAVRAGDRGGDDAGGAEARGPTPPRARRRPRRRGAPASRHDALAHCRRAADLELRLDQQHEVGVVGRGDARARAARCVSEMNERSAGDERRARSSTPAAPRRGSRRHVAHVEPLDERSTPASREIARELAVPDVDRDHRLGAAFAAAPG